MTISECVALAAKEAELINDIYFKCRNQQSIIAVSLANSCNNMENAEDIFKTIKDMAADNLQAMTDILGEEILNRVYECKLTQEEIDNLDPFDRFQYLKYGNILPTQKSIFKNAIEEDAEPVKTQAEINYEFSLEEPPQHETQD